MAVVPIGCGDPAPHYETIPPAERTTAGVVKGRAHRHDGSSAAGGSVTIYGEVFRQHPASNGLDALTVPVDASGGFVFRDIPPGVYRLALSGRGRQETITVRAGEAIVLELTQDKPQRLHHGAKPYGAPPARRRIV
jgi:hypothetical protein